MKSISFYISKALQLSGMATLPFAIFFGESEKSMMLELKYLVLGIIIFLVGFIIENKFVKT
jgi:hypothetical protein